MPSVPQLLKNIVLTLDGEDFAPDAIDAELVAQPGDVQTVKTLDGVSHSDAEAGTWALRINAVVDWDTTRPGLAHYLFANDGDKVAFEFRANTDAISTSNPSMKGTVTLVPMSYGGNGNEYAESEVLLPVDGAITEDTTP